jgi:hypothetical protein
LTNSALAVRTGNQEPRVCNAPDYVTSDGRDAVDLAASAGVFLDPWQQLSLEVMLGRTSLGMWAAFEFAELVARQNGKGEILLARALAGLYLLDERLILHSAHEFKTAAEAFLRIKAVIEGAPHLSKLVKATPSSHGNEGIELVTGQRLRFVARSKSSGRGFTGDTILLDEAQQLPRAAVGALLPTLSARPNPQVCYFGTVPTPENDAEHWTSVRDRGRKGDDASLAWMEWSPGVRCDDLDDRAAWIAANPALGYRITEETIARERNALSPEAFMAERLSVWPEFTSKAVIDPHDWQSCRAAEQYLDQPGPELDGSSPVAFALEVDPGRMWASIAAAGPCIEGGTALDIIDHRPDVDWVLARMVELVAKHSPKAVLIDQRSPAGSLIRSLEAEGVEVMKVDTAEVVKATGDFYDDVKARKVKHRMVPELDAAVAGATKRPVGDAWLFDRKAGMVVTPLVAVTLARWGHLEVEAPIAEADFYTI